MAKRTPKAVAAEISLLLPQLKERGFVNIKPHDVEEALDIVDYTYVVQGSSESGSPESKFYRKEVNSEVPPETSFIPVESPEVLDLVGSYLLSNPCENHDTKYTVARNARFLPDPSEPTTDLEELALEQARLEGQQRERKDKREELSTFLSLSRDIVPAQELLGNYLSLLEQHLPELALPGKEDATERQAYVEKFFSEAVAVRGNPALAVYLLDLEKIALEGVTTITTAFVQSAPTLYQRLSVNDAKIFVHNGIDKLNQYKMYLASKESFSEQEFENIKRTMGELVGYFSLKSDAAKQIMTDLIVKENEVLIPLYESLKWQSQEAEARVEGLYKSLKETEATVESLRKRLEENIREKSNLEDTVHEFQKSSLNSQIDFAAVHAKYEQLQKKYDEEQKKYGGESALLEQEREKTARLEDASRGSDMAYKTAHQKNIEFAEKLAEANASFADVKENFAEYKTAAAQKSERISRRTGLAGIAVGALSALLTVGIIGLYSSSEKEPTSSKPVPAVTAPSAPATTSYDPRGKSKTQVDKDLTAYIKQKQQEGEEFLNLGPGCTNVLEQLYTRMGGVKEGKDYFLRAMDVSTFCSGIPENKLIKLNQ